MVPASSGAIAICGLAIVTRVPLWSSPQTRRWGRPFLLSTAMSSPDLRHNRAIPWEMSSANHQRVKAARKAPSALSESPEAQASMPTGPE